ncbi:hypothetical protein Tsubulata_016708, partial [Turnera subulata]
AAHDSTAAGDDLGLQSGFPYFMVTVPSAVAATIKPEELNCLLTPGQLLIVSALDKVTDVLKGNSGSSVLIQKRSGRDGEGKRTEPYVEMVEAKKKVAKLEVELPVEKKNLVSVGYKNAIGARRASWRILSSFEQKEEAKGNDQNVERIKEYMQRVIDEPA